MIKGQGKGNDKVTGWGCSMSLNEQKSVIVDKEHWKQACLVTT